MAETVAAFCMGLRVGLTLIRQLIAESLLTQPLNAGLLDHDAAHLFGDVAVHPIEQRRVEAQALKMGRTPIRGSCSQNANTA